MAVRDTITDPIARAHLSRSGKPQRQPYNLRQRDVLTVLQPGWLPTDDYLDGLELEGLVELRDAHDRHLEQMTKANRELGALKDKFEQEDKDWDRALQDAFSEGEDPTGMADPRTPQEQRDLQLYRAQQIAGAAGQAALHWASEAFQRLHELIPVWEQTLTEEDADTQAEIDQLNAQIDELKKAQRADQSLRGWFERTRKGVLGTHMPFMRIETTVPPQPKTLGPFGQVAKRQAAAARGQSLDDLEGGQIK